MGRVLETTVNDLGEVTGAVVFKGSSNENVKRHASVLIPLLSDCEFTARPQNDTQNEIPVKRNPPRASARRCAQKNRKIFQNSQ